MNQTINTFKSRTGTVHRRLEGSNNALPCNSSGRAIRGTPGVSTREELAGHKLCEKCFPVQT